MTRMSPQTAKQQMMLDTTSRRDEAQTLLGVLLDARATSERNLARIGQPDLVKSVTGVSSMDNAIASTQRLIDSFNRVIGDLKANLDEEDIALLAELESGAG